MELRVAACQILTFPAPMKSADKIAHWVEQAAADGVDVVAFPEAAVCGYVSDPAYWQQADPQALAAAEALVAQAAARCDVAVVLGTAHWEDGRVFDSLLLIDRDGTVRGRYS